MKSEQPLMPDLRVIQGGKQAPCQHEFKDVTSWRQKLSGRRSAYCGRCGVWVDEGVLSGLSAPAAPEPEGEAPSEEELLDELTTSLGQLLVTLESLGDAAERAAGSMEHLDKSLDGG